MLNFLCLRLLEFSYFGLRLVNLSLVLISVLVNLLHFARIVRVLHQYRQPLSLDLTLDILRYDPRTRIDLKLVLRHFELLEYVSSLGARVGVLLSFEPMLSDELAALESVGVPGAPHHPQFTRVLHV